MMQLHARWRVGITLSVIALASAFRCWRPGERFLLPDGYVGWVRVTYGVSGAPHLPLEDGFRVVTVPTSGDVVTSEPPLYGESLKNEYYYVTPQGRRPARSEGGGFSVPAGKQPAHQYFFVGTGEQAERFKPAVPSAPVVGSVRDDAERRPP